MVKSVGSFVIPEQGSRHFRFFHIKDDLYDNFYLLAQ